MLNLSKSIAMCFLLVVVAGLAAPASAADLKLSSSSLSFIAVAGKDPAPQQFAAYADQAVASFAPSLLAVTQTGNWLAVSTAAGGSLPASVTVVVAVKSAALPVGDYAGQITVSQAGLQKSPATVGVSLKIIPAAPYIAVTPGSLETLAMVGVDPAPLFLSAANAGTGTLAPAFALAPGSGNWLSLSQPVGGSFTNSASVRLDIHSAALPAGTYTATVTVTSATATNSPVNVPVKLTVGNAGGPVIGVAPVSLSFLAGLGANPVSQPLTVNNTGSGTLRPTFNATTASGGNWLLLSSSGGGSFTNFNTSLVSCDITGLLKGTYNGTITVSDPSAANSPVAVPVVLTVDDAKPVLFLDNTAYTFSSPVGDFSLASFLGIYNHGTGLLKWTATVSNDGTTKWLSVSPLSGETGQFTALNFAVNSSGLPSGIYHATITISSNAVSGNATQTVSVALAVGVPVPAINAGGVVNGASFLSKTVAPGEIVSIFGREMGPKLGVLAGLVGGKLPTQLANVRVLFSGIPAALFYASDVQLNVQVPVELLGSDSALVQVILGDLQSESLRVNLRAADPGVFQAGGRPCIFFANSTSQVTAENPARAGDYLTIWATGLGDVEAAIQTGAPAVAALRTRVVPRITVGGVQASVLYAGLAPGFVGLNQINIQVPDGVPAGDTALIVSIGDGQTEPLVLPIR
jgi:uncharacterized protein (TIGR03437 family)